MTSLIIPQPLTTLVDYPEVTLPVVTITRGTAIRLAEKAVSAKGANHVQSACYYGTVKVENDDDTTREVGYGHGYSEKEVGPGCIVGYVLYLLLGPVAFDAAVKQGAVDNGNTFNAVWDNVPGYAFTNEAKRFLYLAQQMQDGRGPNGTNTPWGEAVNTARILSFVPGLDEDDYS